MKPPFGRFFATLPAIGLAFGVVAHAASFFTTPPDILARRLFSFVLVWFFAFIPMFVEELPESKSPSGDCPVLGE
jgi:hypothetical protein